MDFSVNLGPLIIGLIFWIVSLIILYLIIRMGAKHGVLDALAVRDEDEL